MGIMPTYTSYSIKRSISMGKIRKTFKILTEKDDKKRYKKIKSLKKSDLVDLLDVCIRSMQQHDISVSQMVPSHKLPSDADENVISISESDQEDKIAASASN